VEPSAFENTIFQVGSITTLTAYPLQYSTCKRGHHMSQHLVRHCSNILIELPLNKTGDA